MDDMWFVRVPLVLSLSKDERGLAVRLAHHERGEAK